MVVRLFCISLWYLPSKCIEIIWFSTLNTSSLSSSSSHHLCENASDFTRSCYSRSFGFHGDKHRPFSSIWQSLWSCLSSRIGLHLPWDHRGPLQHQRPKSYVKSIQYRAFFDWFHLPVQAPLIAQRKMTIMRKALMQRNTMMLVVEKLQFSQVWESCANFVNWSWKKNKNFHLSSNLHWNWKFIDVVMVIDKANPVMPIWHRKSLSIFNKILFGWMLRHFVELWKLDGFLRLGFKIAHRLSHEI